ncbi:MAG: UDP-N-acetylglucosamine 1-carboxyvinyltransferase [Candidatus Kerfeldbacteria bacterium]|nr:UDP-N-acetylglucosamine 1-carboxyvinyltransferase [Candidatus Kerfeldbacteria bacterium]
MANTLIVTGGEPLHGTIALSGAKNAASKILLATLLSAEPSVIHNVPMLGELDITAEILGHLGCRIDRRDHDWTVETSTIARSSIPQLSRRNRLPILTLGPLLARTGEAEVPVVGGDAIGPRPVNYHLAALKAMGADVEVTEHSFRARAKRLHGAEISFPYPSVGATESVVMAAVLAEGRTVVHNAAIEPEVLDLLQMLQTMGAIIELGTNRTLVIDGVEQLHGTQYTVIPDRIEAASFASLALATDGDIIVSGACQADLMTYLTTIRRLGGGFEVRPDGIRFFRQGRLTAIHIETDTHPGFMTDWQQPLVTVLTQAHGQSTIHETVYEDRFGYTKTLQQMGAKIETSTDCWGQLPCRWWAHGYTHSCQVTGPTPLKGTMIEIPDIRAGMAHLIAALVAHGESRLVGVEHLDRGYQDLTTRLQGLGARLKRENRVD